MHRWNPLVRLAFAVFAIGCGCGRLADTAKDPVFPVTGRVLRGDDPVAGVIVNFHPHPHPSLDASGGADNRQIHIPTGITDEQGRFSLTTDGCGPGAPVGDYAVTLALPQRRGLAPPGSPLTDGFAAAYLKPEKPFARISIQPGDNAIAPFRVPQSRTNATAPPAPPRSHPQ